MASTTTSSVKAETREATLLAWEAFKEKHDLEMQEMKPKAQKEQQEMETESAVSNTDLKVF